MFCSGGHRVFLIHMKNDDIVRDHLRFVVFEKKIFYFHTCQTMCCGGGHL
jgi:hypothetical protein